MGAGRAALAVADGERTLLQPKLMLPLLLLLLLLHLLLLLLRDAVLLLWKHILNTSPIRRRIRTHGQERLRTRASQMTALTYARNFWFTEVRNAIGT